MKYFQLLVVSLSGLSIAGCMSLFDQHNESQPAVNQQPVKILQIPQHPDTSFRDYSGFSPVQHNKSLNDYAVQLVMQLETKQSIRGTIAVASFVEFDESLRRTNQLGNQLAEAVQIELANIGYPVTDVNVTNSVKVSKQGNFAFSRSGSSDQSGYCCMLSGTIIYEPKGIRVNAKLVDYAGNRLLGASSVVIPYFVVEHLAP